MSSLGSRFCAQHENAHSLPLRRSWIVRPRESKGLWIARLMSLAVILMMTFCGNRVAAQVSTIPPVLTEDEAVAIARTANRSSKSSAIGIDRAVQSIKQARTAFMPQSSLQVTSGYPLEDFNLTIPKGALGTYSGTGPIPNQDEHISNNPQF